MRMGVYIVFAFLSTGSLLWPQDRKSPLDPLWKKEFFVLNGQDSVLVLSHRFVIPGTVEIIADSVVLDPKNNYEMDFLRGEVRFFQPPDSGSSIQITYRHLPIALPLMYRHWTVSDTSFTEEKAAAVVSTIKPSPEVKQAEFEEELQKSGSIFRGITLGTNQGMRLNSGLRLQISGKIASKVDVVASLTDQNTPIQPEGNTQTLQEIDKVFVTIAAPGFRTTLGDYVLNVQGMEFGSYSRKLQGAMGTAEASFGSVTLSAAASKGEFTTNHFMGQEANQGPYQLTGSKGQREIIVLAGTERVWVDGERMTRGEENDYTIEYGNGQITFSRKRLITGDSRITVDFEYSDQKFQKEIYGAKGEIRLLRDRLRIQTSFLREADDKENPLDIPLTDAYRSVLSKAGDNPDSAVVSGVQYTGENKGTYEKLDSSGVVFYRYVGENRGDFNVRFSYVGQKKGDYSFQGYGIYRYEGQKKGSYLPLIYLPVATCHQMVDMASTLELGKGIRLKGALGVSDLDANRYSPLDDKDNVDVACLGQFQLDQRQIRLFGKTLGALDLEGRIRSVGNHFRSVGRMTEVEHGRTWGVEEGVTWGERIQEIQGTYRPFSSWTLEGELGSFKREDDVRSNRSRMKTVFRMPKLPQIQYQAERIATQKQTGLEGYWLRQQGSLEGRFWSLIPSLRYQGEHRKEESADSVFTGFRFDEWTGRLAIERGFLKGELSETVRDDRRYAGGTLGKNSLSRTDQMTFDFRWGGGVSSSFLYTHRNRNYTDPQIQDQISDLADVKFRFSPSRRFLEGTLNYRFSSTQVSQMVRDTIRVGEGLGNYRYDENLKELVLDPDGDILLRTIQTGTFLPVNDLQMGGELRLDGSQLWRKKQGFQKFLSAWETRSMIRIERRDKQRDFGRVNLSAFHPEVSGEDSTVVMGLVSFHQDLEYTAPSAGFSFRIRYRSNDSEDFQLLQEGLIRHTTERSFRIKGNPLKGVGFLMEYQNQKESKAYSLRAWSNRDIRSQILTLEASYRPKQKIEVALKTKMRIAEDRVPNPATEAASVFVVPRFGYAFLGKGQLRAELEVGEVHSAPSNRSLPYEMMEGDQPGRTVRVMVLFTYRLSTHVMATLNYRGRQEPWRKQFYQTGQAEVRAFF